MHRHAVQRIARDEPADTEAEQQDGPGARTVLDVRQQVLGAARPRVPARDSHDRLITEAMRAEPEEIHSRTDREDPGKSPMPFGADDRVQVHPDGVPNLGGTSRSAPVRHEEVPRLHTADDREVAVASRVAVALAESKIVEDVRYIQRLRIDVET